MLAFRPDSLGGGAPVRAAPSLAARNIAPPASAAPSAPGAAVVPAATAATAVSTRPAGEVGWSDMIAAIELDGPTRMLALNCALLGREPGLLRLRLDPRQAGARTRSREEKLTQALARFLGEALRLEIEVAESATETPAQSGERLGQQALAAAQAALQADPTVQALQERFGATLSPESVRLRSPA